MPDVPRRRDPSSHDSAVGGQTPGMEKFSLDAIAGELTGQASATAARRTAQTVHGGHEHTLRQTVVALAAGSSMSEHENPGEATVQVLHGRVRLISGDVTREGRSGDLLIVPDARHAGSRRGLGGAADRDQDLGGVTRGAIR
jgi:quercetin dioxygenase-like cupin family protein